MSYTPQFRCIHVSDGGLDETEPASQTSKLVLRLLLHEVEAHCQQRQPEHQIERAEYHLLLRGGRVEAGTRDVVAEADSGERHEAEVRGDQVLPVLAEAEEQRAERDVADHQRERHADRHADFLYLVHVGDQAERTSPTRRRSVLTPPHQNVDLRTVVSGATAVDVVDVVGGFYYFRSALGDVVIQLIQLCRTASHYIAAALLAWTANVTVQKTSNFESKTEKKFLTLLSHAIALHKISVTVTTIFTIVTKIIVF